MKHSKQFYQEKYSLIEQLFKTGDYNLKQLQDLTGIKYDSISKMLKNRGFNINPNGKLEINSDIFLTIDTEEKAYWLGFLYADGSVYKNKKGYYTIELGLQESDIEQIKKFKQFLSSKHTIKYRKESKSYRLLFSDQKIANNLIKLGCFERKSLTLKFPTEEQVPKYLLKHFVRGYFDGDGSVGVYKIGNNDNCVMSLLGTKEFLKELINTLNLPNKTFYSDKRLNGNTFSFCYSGNYCFQILNYLYDGCSVSLDRKEELYNQIKNKVLKGELLSYKKKNSSSNANLNKIEFNV